MSHTSETGGRTLSYLVNDYIDLKDVVMAVEKMIADTSTERNKTLLREECRMSLISLPDQQAFVLRITLPYAVHMNAIKK